MSTANATAGVADHVTVRDLAEALGVPLDRVRRMADRGTIRTVSFGPNTRRLVPPDELERLRALGFTVPAVRTVRDSLTDTKTETMKP